MGTKAQESKTRYAFHLLKQLIIKHGQHRHNDALETLQKELEEGYTVIGIYGDNQQPWMVQVNADSPLEAAIAGINKTYDGGKNGPELEDIFVVEVVAGKMKGILDPDRKSVV